MLVQHCAFVSLQDVHKPEFKEGINVLSLTSDVFEVLSTLLNHTHVKLMNEWEYERVVPVCASGYTLDKNFL